MFLCLNCNYSGLLQRWPRIISDGAGEYPGAMRGRTATRERAGPRAAHAGGSHCRVAGESLLEYLPKPPPESLLKCSLGRVTWQTLKMWSTIRTDGEKLFGEAATPDGEIVPPTAHGPDTQNLQETCA